MGSDCESEISNGSKSLAAHGPAAANETALFPPLTQSPLPIRCRMKAFLSACLVVAFLTSLPLAAWSQGLHDQRTWTGKNGRAIEARFESREGSLLVLAGKDGKTLKVDQANLSDNDLRWLDEAEKSAATPPAVPAPAATPGAKPAAGNAPTVPAQPGTTPAAPPADTTKPPAGKKAPPLPPLDVPAPEGCSPVVVADAERSKLPRLDHLKFDKEPGSSVPSSFISFLMFWKDQNVVGTTTGQTQAERSTWTKEAHTDLIRSMRVRKTTKADFTKLGEEFTKFVRKDTKNDNFLCVVKTETDVRPENLARWTHGAYATILRISHSADGKPTDGYALPVVSATPAGVLKINAWGTDLTAKMVASSSGDGSYDIQMTDAKRTPAWLGDGMHSLKVDPKSGDALFIVAPFRKDDPKAKK